MANAVSAAPPVDRAALRRAVAAARGLQVDARIPALVPGFDAPFFQAGLAGYSDGAMRVVARRQGCPFCVTEALLDRTLSTGARVKRQEDPDLLAESCGLGDPQANRLAGLDDHPIAGQIMGTDPDEMARAAAVLVQRGYDVVDINLACPVKKVRRRNRGGHFLSAPRAAIELLRAVRAAVPATVPCTVKLRRAFDDTEAMTAAFFAIFDAAYELGFAWATVHARTVVQKYAGAARWPFLAELVRRRPDRLIFGSGDVWRVEDIFAMLEQTGVHAVAVARGCIGNPWIFREARDLIAGLTPVPPSIAQQREVLRQHYMLAAAVHGEASAARSMRKFAVRFASHHPDEDAVRRAFTAAASAADWEGVLARWYGVEPPRGDIEARAERAAG